MKDWKRICKKLISPPPWLMIVLTIISTAALVLIFIKGWENMPFAYGVFVLSAYALTVICIFCAKTIPDFYRRTKQKIHSHPFGSKFFTDVGFKVRITLYVSLGTNLIYSVFKLITGIIYSSFWWGAVAVYYMLLALLQFLLLGYMHSSDDRQGIVYEYRRSRLCGMIMLILNLSLTGIIFQMVAQNKSYSYPGILIYAAAAYTFCNITISIMDIVKHQKYNRPILSAAKDVRFCAALVSLLSLETAMLAQFGDDESFRRVMTAGTGAVICFIILTLSMSMIVRSTKKIRQLKFLT